MKILHIVPCVDEANGVCQVARMLAKKQSADGHESTVVTARDFTSSPLTSGHGPVSAYAEIWIHGMWLPREWRACRKVLRCRAAIGVPRLIRMTHGSLSPVYLERQGKWKKRLAAPIERWLFSKTDRVAITGAWEEEWCRKWGLKNEFEVVDLKQFFKLRSRSEVYSGTRPLHVLYLGRRHPLKGVEYLEKAVEEINGKAEGNAFDQAARTPLPLCELRVESALFGEAKEAAWEWCDVLCLPTLSENFGLVVAEALTHGKRVITTDGAPAWGPREKSPSMKSKSKSGIANLHSSTSTSYFNSLITYLRGYREGTDEERVKLLKDALQHAIMYVA